jgi:hypothetical protein
MTPTFIAHCETLYRALAERATIQRFSEDDSQPAELVFKGAVVPVYKSLGISQTYYGPIFETLEDVGAILKIQQGARGIDTVIVLRGLPKKWPASLGWNGARSEPLTDATRYAKLLHEVQEIQHSIGGINVLLALAELEERMIRLESRVLNQSTMEGNATNGEE